MHFGKKKLFIKLQHQKVIGRGYGTPLHPHPPRGDGKNNNKNNNKNGTKNKDKQRWLNKMQTYANIVDPTP